MREQSRVVGADTVFEGFQIPISARAKKVFHYSPDLLAVQASAQDGVAGAFFWLQNPAASVVDLAIRKLVLRFGTVNTLTSTEPRIVLAKFTFTTVPSGATTPPTPQKPGDSNACDMRMANTGFGTITVGTRIASFLVPQMHAAGQFFGPPPQEWPSGGNDPFEDDDVILAPGTGAVLYQPDAGTASDPRDFTADLRAEEVQR